MKDAQESLFLNPNYSKAYYILAKLFFLKENNADALKNILIAKKIGPKHTDFKKLEADIEAAMIKE
jgi:hypothetical protein